MVHCFLDHTELKLLHVINARRSIRQEGVVQTNMASVCRTWRDYQMKDAPADDEELKMTAKVKDEPRQSEPMTGVESVDGA